MSRIREIQIFDSAGGSITSTAGSLDTNITNTVPVTMADRDVNLNDSAGTGITSTGTSLNVNVTNTVTATANAGTNLNTSALALESGGNLATIAGKDFATQTTLATRASESTLSSINGKDFATQTTLATRASEATLASLNGKDFATQTTVATLATSANQTNGTQQTQIVDAVSGLQANVIGDGSLVVINQSYEKAIAEGYITGHTTFYKKGLSPAASATETTLWNPATAYVFPAAAISIEVISSSANDIDTTGTGARTVYIEYLDDTYATQTATLALNGVAAVAGPTDFFRLNRFYVLTAGSGGKTAGTVSLRLVGGAATVYGQIGVGQTDSRSSIYTVPLGKTLYITDIVFSCAYSTAGKSERITLHASKAPENGISTTGTIFWPYTEIMLIDNVYVSSSQSVLKFDATTDIKVSVIGETNAICTSEIRGWLE